MIKNNVLSLRQYFAGVSLCLMICFSVLLSMSTFPFLPGVVDDFVFDDKPAVLNNKDVNDLVPYDIFRHDYWGQNITSKTSHKEHLLS